MVKRAALLFVGVAVLAGAIPAMASASSLTKSAGTLVPVGTPIRMTGSDIIIQSTLLGNITCQTLNTDVEVTKNSANTFEAFGANTAPATTGCVDGTKTVVVTSLQVTKLESSVSSSGTMSFVAVYDIGTATCTFTGSSVAFTYSAGTGSHVIKFNAASGIKGSPAAACGTGNLTGEFTLELLHGGTAVLLD
jgi:hypothetical protein